MRFIVLFSILFSILSTQAFAQDFITLKLKNETIEEVNLPIKVGKVICSVPNSEIGSVNIPELNKYFYLKFEKDIATEVKNYISYLQTGEQYIDTVNLNITKFKIYEEIADNGDEKGILDLEIEFYKSTSKQRVSLYNFKEKIEISDPNVTIFHEYNVRKGITESLKWLASQKNISQFFVIENTPKLKKKTFIKSDIDNRVFQYSNTTTKDFREVENFMTRMGSQEINNRIKGRSFVNGLAGTIGTLGIISTTIGVFKYDKAAEQQIDSGNAGQYLFAGLGALFSAFVIQAIGKQAYRTTLIKQYNALQLEQPAVFKPHNPIQIGFSLSLK